MPAARIERPKNVARPRPLSICTCTPLCGLAAPTLTCVCVCAAQPESKAQRRTAHFTAAILRLFAGALQAVAHRAPFRSLGRGLDQDALAAGRIELAQRGIKALRVRLRLARHAQPVVDALVGA